MVGEKDMSIAQDRNLISNYDLGFYGNNVVNLALTINIPYSYLLPDGRKGLNYLVRNFIRPNVRDKLRQQKEAGILGREISSQQKRFQPQEMAIPRFLESMKEADMQKINHHFRMANFLATAVLGLNKDPELFETGKDLYRRSREVESLQLALSSKIKEFLDYYEDNVLSRYSLTAEERILVMTPSLLSCVVQRGLDFLRYRLALGTSSETREKSRLLALYFNNDELQFESFRLEHDDVIASIDDEGERTRVKEYIFVIEQSKKTFREKKIDFLRERPVRYGQEVDNLLLLDNCLHGYYISKEWFHHDLFLKIFLISIIEGCSFYDLVQSIEGRAKEIVFYPDERLL